MSTEEDRLQLVITKLDNRRLALWCGLDSIRLLAKAGHEYEPREDGEKADFSDDMFRAIEALAWKLTEDDDKADA